MLSQLINRECQILRRSASAEIDDYGNEVPDVDVVTTVWEVQQRVRKEHDDAVADTDWVGFFLPGEDVDSGDAVVDVTSGHRFEIVGDPWPVRNPRTQAESHVEAGVRRTAGSEDGS